MQDGMEKRIYGKLRFLKLPSISPYDTIPKVIVENCKNTKESVFAFGIPIAKILEKG